MDMHIGYKLSSEAFSPAELVRQALRAEEAVVRPFVDAGFDHIVLNNAGPDPDGFIDFFADELAPRLRALTPSGPVPSTASTQVVP
ncbi:hypothetical protein [Humibacter ginsenosidimutans]|uniref:hypothetical protein n=1 Tax=Humibacter ginsenosidimutans TaxID=2599293 RepID=UPI00143DEC8E|nr:hypothetical protein [Humibacter ginsenosidimutans]